MAARKVQNLCCINGRYRRTLGKFINFNGKVVPKKFSSVVTSITLSAPTSAWSNSGVMLNAFGTMSPRRGQINPTRFGSPSRYP